MAELTARDELIGALCEERAYCTHAAIYMADYAPTRVRSIVKPILEILAGIPTVVFGFFAALPVAPAHQPVRCPAGPHPRRDRQRG